MTPVYPVQPIILMWNSKNENKEVDIDPVEADTPGMDIVTNPQYD